MANLKTRIIKDCLNCNKEFEVAWNRRLQKFCCRKCQTTGNFNPNFGNHPVPWNKGKKWSEEVITKFKMAKKDYIPWNKNKGKGWINSQGYREFIRDGKKVKLHRYLWCVYNSFPYIPKGCVVHHTDGDRLNNSKENLVLLQHGYHTNLHRKINKINRII